MHVGAVIEQRVRHRRVPVVSGLMERRDPAEETRSPLHSSASRRCVRRVNVCASLCFCVHVCVCVCVCVCSRVCAHVCMRVWLSVHVPLCLWARIYVRACVCVE